MPLGFLLESVNPCWLGAAATRPTRRRRVPHAVQRWRAALRDGKLGRRPLRRAPGLGSVSTFYNKKINLVDSVWFFPDRRKSAASASWADTPYPSYRENSIAKPGDCLPSKLKTFELMFSFVKEAGIQEHQPAEQFVPFVLFRFQCMWIRDMLVNVTGETEGDCRVIIKVPVVTFYLTARQLDRNGSYKTRYQK